MTQIKNSTKDLSLIAVFAYNIEANNKSLIASIIYKYDFYNIRYTDLRKWDVSNFRSEYNEPFNIIRVLKRRDDIINNIYKYKDKDYDLNKTFLNISEQKNINHILILDHLFFTEKFLDDYLFSNKFNLINSAFIFDFTEWKDLVHKFKILNITLSGGSNTKRQVLSPVQLNLARFLISIDGFKDSHKTVVNSFNIHEEVHGKVSIINFSKDYKIWLLREYIRLIPNPNNNNREFYSLILFWNNIHAQNNIKSLFNVIDIVNPNNFMEQLKQLIETTKINFKLDSNFLDEDYINNFYGKLKTSDLNNYSLDKRFKSFEELCIAIEAYRTKGTKVSGLKSKKKNLNRSNKINTAGLGVRKYSSWDGPTQNIKFKDSTMNDESIKSDKLNLVAIFDICFITLVVFWLFQDIIIIISNLLEYFNKINIEEVNDIISYMNSTGQNTTSNSTTTTTIIHNDSGWSSGIRTLFLYGTGAFRITLLRSGGTPFQRSVIIGSTIAADAITKVLHNTINDPNYVASHINSWKSVLSDDKTTATIKVDSETQMKLEEINKFLPDGLNNFTEELVKNITDILKSVIEPVQVDYSISLLANQIHNVSIMLFILSVLIIILLLGLLINILIFAYSDKLINYFSNKYIKMYIGFNKKIIGVEICFLGGSLLYFMYTLSFGIHFIATHPIIID